MKSEVQPAQESRHEADSRGRLRRPLTWALLAAVAAAAVLLGAALLGLRPADQAAAASSGAHGPLQDWQPAPDKSEVFDLETRGAQGGDLWSDGATVWVTDYLADEVLAYRLRDGQRLPAQDIKIHHPRVRAPFGLWSDGTTMWIASSNYNRAYAYSLSTRAPLPALNIQFSGGNDASAGIWADGTTMWVLDSGDEKLYAYELAGGARQPDKDIALQSDSPIVVYRGVWGNGTTVWVSELFDTKLRAYALADGNRLPDRDIALHSENDLPSGLWSDGRTMYVIEVGYRSFATLRAYARGVWGDELYGYSAAELIAEPDGVAIYRDASSGAAAVRRLTEGRALLTKHEVPHWTVTGVSHPIVSGLAGKSSTLSPRFFASDPTADDWVGDHGTNNGGLRWLKAWLAERALKLPPAATITVGNGSTYSGKALADWPNTTLTLYRQQTNQAGHVVRRIALEFTCDHASGTHQVRAALTEQSGADDAGKPTLAYVPLDETSRAEVYLFTGSTGVPHSPAMRQVGSRAQVTNPADAKALLEAVKKSERFMVQLYRATAVGGTKLVQWVPDTTGAFTTEIQARLEACYVYGD